ncbi:MAG: amino acid permease [Candidatus Eremiobacteraeota bacterium]|nr:amino acid permease [Candidatus Eremiobacteraeota bacterium]MBV8721928.1 amino acid permease [Candidatus Eremiobacteraeota bacterium]
MLLQRVKPLARILAEGANQDQGLKRSLGPWALTAMGIGAIIGTGIFVLTGVASATRAGPSLTVSFVVAGVVSALAALCYAEVASKVPISGSAYTYTYATMGEFFAWIVGWGLVCEYALGASTVSVGWSGYFTNILQNLFHVTIPMQWQHSHWDPTPGIANLPAAGIILLITALLVKGTRESGTVNGIIVTIKVAVVLFFIAIGIGHINPANYHLAASPATGEGGFFPFGWEGMLGGAAFIFFAYIGFDAVSTTAEEAKNPGKDLPFGIIMSLVICTALYIVVVAILNGMVPFNQLNVPNPVAFALNQVGLTSAGLVISFGAIAGLTTVLLVMMYGQTRVFYAMSRDGLIPPMFVALHPTFRTPWISQIVFGLLIAAAGAFFPIGILGSLTNMGTLVAFVLVSCAVPLLRKNHPDFKGTFQVPFGPYVIPVLSAITALGLIFYLKVGNPTWWGIPVVWLWFVLWLLIGLAFYFSYGRHKSTVALEEAEGLAIRQPRVN